MRAAASLGFGVAALGLAASSAAAQTVEYTPDFDPDRFVVTSDPYGIGLTEGARPLARLEYTAGLALRLGGPPLSICVQNDGTGACEVEGDLVNSRFGADLVGALGLGRVGVHVQLPVVLYQSSDFDPAMGESGLSAAAIGDLRLGSKLAIARFGDAALGWDMTFSLPTGGGDNFVGDQGTVIENRALFDWRRDRIAAGVGVGYAFRSHTGEVGDLAVDDEVVWSAAGQYQVSPGKLDLGLAVFGRVGVVASDLDWEERPAEVMASTVYWMSRTVSLEGGAGMALDSGYGMPFRVLAAVRWTDRRKEVPPPPPPPPPKDTDGDGLFDPADDCVTDPEDKDGFEDGDGCPELDNDQDGVLDAAPDECPIVPEDPDQFEDTDGCPELDNDQDTFLDADDGCPNDAEDPDQFEDTDGCPELDNDQDSILDPVDACPIEPETANGYQDSDGCPDDVPKTLKEFTGIIKGITFELDSAKIKKSSNKTLDAAAQILIEFADTRLEIQGHTDDTGTDEYNVDLSQRRADAVKAYLVKQGVTEDRLVAKGYGKTVPLDDRTTKAARAKNRRVEFRLISAQSPAGTSAP